MARLFTVGLIGARGFVGRELVRVVENHPSLRLVFVSSRSAAGELVSTHMDGVKSDIRFTDVRPEHIAAHHADVYVLALSNGEATPYVSAIDAHHASSVVIDISADHRFSNHWSYGLPELNRDRLKGARRIANPGCYATAAQLALRPILELLDGNPSVFGISGYSGAGATPSPRNDVEVLKDNIMPYALVGHTHEKEISHQLGRHVFFTPHVGPFFRGLVVTASCTLEQSISAAALTELFTNAYAKEPLIKLVKEPPLPKDAANKHGAAIGGFSVDESQKHAVICATLDNLLKGAASQAIQNINLALGLDELAGLTP